MDVVNIPKKEIRDMDVMELIEEITETTKIARSIYGERTESVPTSPLMNVLRK